VNALPHATPITRLLHEFRWKLTLTYSLFAVESLGLLLRPYFLGAAVDGLLDGQQRDLVILVIVHLSYLIVGTVRHMYDTRTFTAIYTEFVTRLLSRPAVVRDVSKLSAHSTLARQVVDFLEFDFNYIVEAAYNIIGSLAILLMYQRTVMVMCLLVLVPILVLGVMYGRRTTNLNRGLYDELENQVDIIAGSDPKAIVSHYHKLRNWQIRLSDQEAWNFGSTEFLVLAVITASLLVSTEADHDELAVGSIIVIYNYILKFAAGLETVPYTIQRMSALKDLMRRMTTEDTNG
jgi:ABC-type bacteriocin/lantibiotic exporter with double-glycine peptidase domain